MIIAVIGLVTLLLALVLRGPDFDSPSEVRIKAIQLMRSTGRTDE